MVQWKEFLENFFLEVERKLLSSKNINSILYEKKDVLSFDSLNQDLLKSISKKSIVYCIWIGRNYEELESVYIGHASGSLSRQRIRTHLTKKNKATGSKLEQVKIAIQNNKKIGLSFVEIEPAYMRKSIEAWLIEKLTHKLKWNINS